MSGLHQVALDLAAALRGEVPMQGPPMWAGGPGTALKARPVTPFEDYLAWLRQVESALGEQLPQLAQRLRRLYYSEPAKPGFGGLGHLFDLVIAWNDEVYPTFASRGRPLVANPPLFPRAVLDALFETDSVELAEGSLVDPSHVFVALDISQNGIDSLAALRSLLERNPGTDPNWLADPGFRGRWLGALTWVGDLASWWIEWNSRRKARERVGTPMSNPERFAVLGTVTERKISFTDLAGNMDGHVIAAEARDRPNVPSELFRSYYGADPQAGLEVVGLHSRFAFFVRHCAPPLDYDAVPGTDQYTLRDSARRQIYEETREVARLFLSFETLKSDLKGEFTTAASRESVQRQLLVGDDVLHEIADRAFAFLQDGLTSGRAVWPRP